MAILNEIYKKQLVLSILMLIWLTINVNGQSISVDANDYKQQFYGVGGTIDGYLGHWLSMAQEDRNLAAQMLTKDLNLLWVKNYINGTPETDASNYDNIVAAINDIRKYGPGVKLQVSCFDLPDAWEEKDKDGKAIKGVINTTIDGIYDSIANYYYAIIEGFYDRGIVVSQLDLLNEPGGLDHAIVDGKRFSESVPKLRSMLNDPLFNTKNIPMPQIVGPSHWSVTGNLKWLQEWKTKLQGAFENTDVVTTHGYQDGWKEQAYTDIFNYIEGKPFVNNEQTGKLQEGDGLYELVGSSEARFTVEDVSIALRISDAINGGVNEFFIFNLNNPSGNNASLIMTPWQGSPSYSGQFYGFKHVTSLHADSSHRVGRILSDIGATRVVTFRKKGEDTLYVHLTELSGKEQLLNLDINNGGSNPYGISAVQGWESNDLKKEALVIDETYASSKNLISIKLDPFSVLTLKITMDTNGPDVALKKQTITFDSIPDKLDSDQPFDLKATASSGLNVMYEVVSGPATINNSTMALNGAGIVTVRAYQPGNGTFISSPYIYKSFYVWPNGKQNVALNKSATVDSKQGSKDGPMAVDGNKDSNDSRWVSANSEFPHWIEIDLKGTYKIGSFAFWTGYNGYNNPITSFDFQVLKDGTWKNIISELSNTYPIYVNSFDPVATNKVRVNFTGGLDNLVRLYEIEVYGEMVGPAAPGNLMAKSVSYNKIDLSWKDNSDNEDGFYLERKTGATGEFTRIDTISVDVMGYSDLTVSPATKYYYRINAFNSAGESGFSDVLEVSTTAITDVGNDQVSGTKAYVYPNPIKSNLNVSFMMKKTGNVRISILTLTGKRLVDIKDGIMSAGRHSFIWDIEDMGMVGRPSGLYILEVTIDGISKTERIAFSNY